MTQPSATILAHSISPAGVEICSMQITMHRFVLAEFNTHRVFSRNFRSSRAVPVNKLLDEVLLTPAMPVVWLSNKPGMQGGEALNEYEQKEAQDCWKIAAGDAAIRASSLMKIGLHKSWANRLLEPFLFVHGIVTSTEWDNFFSLRCHPDAQPEIRALAEAMQKAKANSVPELLRLGDWHLPYILPHEYEEESIDQLRKVSTARCARVSHRLFDGTVAPLVEELKLYEKLVGSVPLHASPAEHQAKAAKAELCSRNFRGWIQNRQLIEEGR